MTPDALMAVACPKIGDLGGAHYFAPATVERGAGIGLDALSFYVLGRGGVMGDVDAAVVSAAFGYFEPNLLEGMWNAGAQNVSPGAAGLEYWAACAELGREKLGDVDDLDALVAAVDAVNAAADPIGLALYAGINALPLAADAPARAMQLLWSLRELRGSAHLVAVRAQGLPAPIAHRITRPKDLALFGWTPDTVPEPTAGDRAKLLAADELTDAIVRPAYAVLDAPAADAMADGLAAIEAALGRPTRPREAMAPVDR